GAGFFAFLAVGPAYFEKEFGITGAAFGVNWTYMAFAFLLGATGGARLVQRFGRTRIFNVFLALCTAIGLTHPGLIALAGATPVTIVAPFVVLSGCLGVISPLALSNAIATQPGMAGTASGLCGALAMAVAAVFTIVAGLIYTGGAYSIVLAMTAAMVSMALCGFLARAKQNAV
ncbi:MAG: hypothetical protein KDE14_10740, partial [Rhodobacteraceae bacterium]|nr:hypothetical protein [Paracoccaceae bacterium]